MFVSPNGTGALAALRQTAGGVIPQFDNYYVEIAGRRSTFEEHLKTITSNAPIDHAISDPPGQIKFWDCLQYDL